jgi:hypothetical protein
MNVDAPVRTSARSLEMLTIVPTVAKPGKSVTFTVCPLVMGRLGSPPVEGRVMLGPI